MQSKVYQALNRGRQESADRIAEEHLFHLPEPVQRYLRFVGSSASEKSKRPDFGRKAFFG
jgi:hypothetical protein